MGRVNKTRFINFRVVDINGAAVTGLTLSNFAVYFTRDGVACSDAVVLQDKSNGRYLATYNPSAAGYDFLELYNAANDIRVQDGEVIDSLGTFFGIGQFSVLLTQDYGGVGALKAVLPNPQNYTLYIFQSQSWQTGGTSPSQAVNATKIDAAGNWVTSPLTVAPDTYHVVVMNDMGAVTVISAFLKVFNANS